MQFMKTLFLIVACTFSLTTFEQNVEIPDANFKAYLVNNLLINTNADTEIQVSEAVIFTGDIDCSNLGISDLTGIEAFTVLTFLDCTGNQLTTLDLSQNTELFYCRCAQNQLTCLNAKNGNNINFPFLFTSVNPDLTCIEVDNVEWSEINWTDIGLAHSFSEDCNNLCSTILDVEEISSTPKELIKIVNLMGRETECKPNTVLIYMYSDGTTEKVFKVEL